MNASASRGWTALDLDDMGVQPLRETELVAISAGIGPAAAGALLAMGFVGAVAVGVLVGVAVFYFTN